MNFLFTVYMVLVAEVSGTQHLELKADRDDVFIGSRLSLTCSTPSPVTVVNWWIKNVTTHSDMTLVQEFLNGSCSQSTHAYADCYCNSTTTFSCAIRSVTVFNEGQRWLCYSAIGGTTVYSNNYTININKWTPKSTSVETSDRKETTPTFNFTIRTESGFTTDTSKYPIWDTYTDDAGIKETVLLTNYSLIELVSFIAGPFILIDIGIVVYMLRNKLKTCTRSTGAMRTGRPIGALAEVNIVPDANVREDDPREHPEQNLVWDDPNTTGNIDDDLLYSRVIDVGERESGNQQHSPPDPAANHPPKRVCLLVTNCDPLYTDVVDLNPLGGDPVAEGAIMVTEFDTLIEEADHIRGNSDFKVFTGVENANQSSKCFDLTCQPLDVDATNEFPAIDDHAVSISTDDDNFMDDPLYTVVNKIKGVEKSNHSSKCFDLACKPLDVDASNEFPANDDHAVSISTDDDNFMDDPLYTVVNKMKEPAPLGVYVLTRVKSTTKDDSATHTVYSTVTKKTK